MLALGILFFLYIPSNALNLATNAIFIGAGVLVIKRAITMLGQARTSRAIEDKKNEKLKRKQPTRK